MTLQRQGRFGAQDRVSVFMSASSAIIIDVPRATRPGTYDVTFTVEGNFDPVSLTFRVTVAPRPLPTTSPGSPSP